MADETMQEEDRMAARFENLCERYGSDMRAWPVDAADEGRALKKALGDRGCAILRDAQQLDLMLGAYEVEPASVDLETAILRTAPQQGGGKPQAAANPLSTIWTAIAGAGGRGLAGSLATGAVAATAFIVSFGAGFSYSQQSDTEALIAALEQSSVSWNAQTEDDWTTGLWEAGRGEET